MGCARGSAKASAKTGARAKVLHVAATDAEGLALENWKATVNGEPAKVLRVAGPEDDLVLLVVLDWSGEPTLIDTAREALVAAVEKLPANHWVGILKAQDALAAIADPGPAREVALKAVREYAATGKAACCRRWWRRRNWRIVCWGRAACGWRCWW